MTSLAIVNDDLIRWFNFVLSFIALACFTANITARRDLIARRTRRIMVWIYALFLYVAYLAGAAIRNHVPISAASYIGIFIFIGVIFSVVWHPEGDDKTPPDDGSAGQWLLERFAEFFDYVHDIFIPDKNDK